MAEVDVSLPVVARQLAQLILDHRFGPGRAVVETGDGQAPAVEAVGQHHQVERVFLISGLNHGALGGGQLLHNGLDDLPPGPLDLADQPGIEADVGAQGGQARAAAAMNGDDLPSRRRGRDLHALIGQVQGVGVDPALNDDLRQRKPERVQVGLQPGRQEPGALAAAPGPGLAEIARLENRHLQLEIFPARVAQQVQGKEAAGRSPADNRHLRSIFQPVVCSSCGPHGAVVSPLSVAEPIISLA